MSNEHGRSGFTLIELMIVVAIIAILAAMGIPKLMSARTNANEAAAIATLRSLSTSQAQVQSSGVLDTDADGAGEFAYFGELSGAQPVRVMLGGVPAIGTVGLDELAPALLASSFANIDATGWVTRSGYHFALFLPATPAGGVVAGIPELGGGGANPASLPNPNAGETYWCCYAWPIDVGGTGMRAFFMNEEGELLQTQNRGAVAFNGAASAPTFDECYNAVGDMSSGITIGAASLVSGQVWTPVHH